jgi:hypothetical protein
MITTVAAVVAATECAHRWWPRPDIGPDVVRCTNCAMTVPVRELSERERVKAFAAHVVRVYLESGTQPKGGPASFASGQWKVYVSQHEYAASLEQDFWETFNRESEVLL